MSTNEAVARAFSRDLLDHLGTEVMVRIIQRNRAETDPNVCHSHDSADANEFMSLAIFEVTGAGQDRSDLWDAAWRLAKEEEFFLELTPLNDWIRENRSTIDELARHSGIPTPVDDDAREEIVLNVESLYLLAQSEGVDV